MFLKGLFKHYPGAKRKSLSGQIAAALTIIIAIIFLFIAITINIGKVSSTKTAVNMAADGAALLLASNLGSTGYFLAEKYLEGKTHDCDVNFWSIIGVILFIVAAIVFCTTGSWQMFELAFYVMAGSALGVITMNAIILPGQCQTFNRLMSSMTEEQVFKESPIQYALFQLCNDPEMVIDVNDYDEDGRRNDKISRFTAWYTWRLYWMAESADGLTEACRRLQQWVRWFLQDDSEVFRKFIAGRDRWPNEPEGVFIDLLGDIEGFDGEASEDIGIVYNIINNGDWNDYINSNTDPNTRDVFELVLSSGNITHDFSFWEDGTNPNNENDPVNDQIDFFIEDLQAFREWCINEEYDNCLQDCRRGRTDDCTCEEIRHFLQIDPEELARTVDSWFPDLQTWVEDTFYFWKRDAGPVNSWKTELLVWGNVRGKIEDRIKVIERQLQSNKNQYPRYCGGLYTILSERQATLTDAEKKHLDDLIEALEGSLTTLKDIGRDGNYGKDDARNYVKNLYYAAFQCDRWRKKYTEFRVNEGGWEDFKRIYDMIKHPGFAEYSWTDSLGDHTVRVDLQINVYEPTYGDSFVPTIRQYTRTLGFEKCGDLKNYRGNVAVTVRRTDTQVKNVNLAQRLLWIFSNPTITRTARARYDITQNGIYVY